MTDAPEIAAIAPPEKKNCGLIMPIAECDGCSPEHWLEVRSIIESAVAIITDPPFIAKMVSDGDAGGTIHGRIVQNVYKNEIVVCDVSGRNPNVLFELGLRIAFDRPVVLIKDDETEFAFDIGPLEHLVYPRSLRHAPMERLKTELARKISAIYKDWYSGKGERPSYIKAFGPITTIEFERKTERSDHAILEALADIGRRIDTMERPVSAVQAAAEGVTSPFAGAAPKSRVIVGRNVFAKLPDDVKDELLKMVRSKRKTGNVDTTWLAHELKEKCPKHAFSNTAIDGLLNYMMMLTF